MRAQQTVPPRLLGRVLQSAGLTGEVLPSQARSPRVCPARAAAFSSQLTGLLPLMQLGEKLQRGSSRSGRGIWQSGNSGKFREPEAVLGAVGALTEGINTLGEGLAHSGGTVYILAVHMAFILCVSQLSYRCR